MTEHPVTHPISILRDKLRRDQDSHAQLLIEARALAHRHTQIRDAAAELDAVIRATRGLLALADRAVQSAGDTTTDTPAKPAKKGTRKP